MFFFCWLHLLNERMMKSFLGSRLTGKLRSAFRCRGMSCLFQGNILNRVAIYRGQCAVQVNIGGECILSHYQCAFNGVSEYGSGITVTACCQGCKAQVHWWGVVMYRIDKFFTRMPSTAQIVFNSFHSKFSTIDLYAFDFSVFKTFLCLLNKHTIPSVDDNPKFICSRKTIQLLQNIQLHI